MIKKVLSLDIDFFFPEMNIYQKYFDVDLTPRQSWQVVRWKAKKNNKKLFFKPCNFALNYVVEVLLNKCKGAKIVGITEHDEILEVLRKNKCENADLYNFDFHEDICYGNEDDNPNLENWIQFARQENLVKRIAWISQDGSRKTGMSTICTSTMCWKDCDWENFPEFDLLVVCTSRHFTPPEYWYLNKKMREIAKKGSDNDGMGQKIQKSF